MRITSKMMTSKYLRNLNSSASELYSLNEKTATGRKFFKGSEDPIGAIKAYKLRREYRDTEIYDSNITNADSFLTIAETNLNEISSSLEDVYVSYLKGITGTMHKEDREIVAKNLDALQDTLLTALNSKAEDKYVFGGTSREEIPFTVDSSGNLLFKGLNVNDTDPANISKLDKLKNENINVDLGMGMKFTGGTLDTDTVFDISMAGIKFMGYGENSEGVPNNLYTLVGKIKDELRSDNFSMDSIKPYLDNFTEQKQNVLVATTELGSKTNYLDYLKQRNEDNQFNLNTKILDNEYIPTELAITEFNMQRYAYNAALSMGTKILQNSFIDFMH